MEQGKAILRNKITKRAMVWIVTFALNVSLLSAMGIFIPDTAQAAVTLHNPIYDSGVREVEPGSTDATGRLHNPVYDAKTGQTTWDCVWFGNYWQSDTNGDGKANKNDEKEPIKWRVLSVDGDDVFLLADKNLDLQPYNTEDTDVTWETCTLRSWLNGYDSSQNACGTDYTSDNFINAAFSSAEQKIIENMSVVNEDNPTYGMKGGNSTIDRVYLLSITEALNAAYGFCDEVFYGADDCQEGIESDTRIAEETAFVNAAYTHTGRSFGGFCLANEGSNWWLRSTGDDSGYDNEYAAEVDVEGYTDILGSTVDYVNGGVRPALHLTLSSSVSLSYAGTVDSKRDRKATWDCVYFGNYWQNDTNGDRRVDKNDAKEPIKWRVLSVDGDDVFLLADKTLDVKPYNAGDTEVTWETCTLRSWLNGYDGSQNARGTDYTSDNFMDAAFSTVEQAAIKNTNVVNEDNPYYDTEGGNDTKDNVYLLSIAEASNTAYGFNSIFRMESNTRVALNTAYVKKCSTAFIPDWWWLRSPGSFSDYAAGVNNNNDYGECGYGHGSGYYVDDDNNAIRPALHLTLSSDAPISYAGTVCSDDTAKEKVKERVEWIASLQIIKDTSTNAFIKFCLQVPGMR